MDNTKKKSNKKMNWKKFGIWSLATVSAVSVFGIAFSTWNFTKNIDSNNSKDVGDKLQVTYNVTLDVDKNATAEQQKESINKQLKDVAKSVYEQTKNQNINDFEITYGIPKQAFGSMKVSDGAITKETTNETFAQQNINPKYGEVNLILSVGDPGLDFNQKIALSDFQKNEKDIKKDPKAALNQQLRYFYRLSTNLNLKLLKFKSDVENNSETAFPSGNDAKNYAYQLNKLDNVSYDADKTLGVIKLDDSTLATNDHDWNLSALQKEFVSIVDVKSHKEPEKPEEPKPESRTESKTFWEKSDYNNQKAMDDFLAENSLTATPKNQYLIWSNRSNLIHRLQIATFAAYIYENRAGFPANSKEIFVATELSKSLTIYEQDFGFWLAKQGTDKTGLSFDIFNEVNPNNDNLIKLLNNYYTNPKVSAPDEIIAASGEEKSVLEQYKQTNKSTDAEKKFLYSWNLEKNQLVDKTLVAIDYANFYKYFESNNAKWLEKNDKSKFYSENYFTRNFLINNLFGPSFIALDKYTKLLNQNQPANLFFNSSLTNLFDISWSFDKVKNSLLEIIDYLSVYEQTNLNTLVQLPTYFAAFIGLFVIILSIGILVSVLYRIPGFVAALATTLSFALSCLMYSSLGLSFSFGVYLLLAIMTLLAYVPIIYFLDYMRMGIKKGYNLWNSFKYALRKFTKIFFGIYVTLLIFGLVFLFFGFLQIQSFGVLLVISSLMGILFNGVIFATVVMILILCIETKYNTLLPQKYVEQLNAISSTTFQSSLLEVHEEQTRRTSFSEKMASKIDFKYSTKNWLIWLMIIFGVISVAGLVLMFVIGPGFSLDYSNGTLISLITNKEVPTEMINSILSSLGYTLIAKNVNVSPDYIETILIFNVSNVNWNDVAHAISNAMPQINAEDPFILTRFSVLENSTLTSFELNDNVVKCLFISFGFCAIWTFIWLNIVNVIPVFLLQLINVFAITGIIGISRIPFTVDSLISLLVVAIFFSCMIYGIMSDLKVNFNMKKTYTKDEIVDFVRNQMTMNTQKINYFILSYLVSNLIFIVFMSSIFWFALLIGILAIIVLYLINYYLTPTFFICAMLLKKVFSHERRKISISKYLHNVETGSSDKSKDFDKVDEQEIYGLNKFRIKEVR